MHQLNYHNKYSDTRIINKNDLHNIELHTIEKKTYLLNCKAKGFINKPTQVGPRKFLRPGFLKLIYLINRPFYLSHINFNYLSHFYL